jgi:hypothetical protein
MGEGFARAALILHCTSAARGAFPRPVPATCLGPRATVSIRRAESRNEWHV